MKQFIKTRPVLTGAAVTVLGGVVLAASGSALAGLGTYLVLSAGVILIVRRR